MFDIDDAVLWKLLENHIMLYLAYFYYHDNNGEKEEEEGYQTILSQQKGISLLTLLTCEVDFFAFHEQRYLCYAV